MTFLYFAYGSNLLRQRLQMENPSAQFVAIAELKGHTLAFSNLGRDPFTDPPLLRWMGGAATITEYPSTSVWGCVWRLGNEHIQTLDRQESVYNAKDVEVATLDNAKCICRTYQLQPRYLGNTDYDNRPSPMYLDIIVKGAKQNDLSSEYIHYLENIESNGVHKQLDIYNRLIELINETGNTR